MTTAQDVEQVLRAEVGYHESPAGSNRTKYGAWYGMDGVPWCAIFISWGLYTAFHAHGQSSPVEGIQNRLGFAYSGAVMDWGKNHGCWRPTPSYGALALYDWDLAAGDQDGVPVDHIGWVAAVDAGDPAAFSAIEGNTSNGSDANGGEVLVQARRNDRGYCLGFVQLPYSGASTTAAAGPGGPAWPGRVLALTTPFTSGADVSTWQRRMIDQGIHTALAGTVTRPLVADGVYGPISDAACRAFQKSRGLVVDGVVGPVTWRAAWE